MDWLRIGMTVAAWVCFGCAALLLVNAYRPANREQRYEGVRDAALLFFMGMTQLWARSAHDHRLWLEALSEQLGGR